jgi:hypothetical protein
MAVTRVELLSLLFTIGAYKICCKIFPRTLRQRNFAPVYTQTGTRGGAVVEAMRYKPEGRGIDS